MLIAGEIGAVVLCASTWAETSSDERSATAPWSWPSGGIQSIVPRNFEYEVVDTGESVTVGFDEQPRPPAPEDEDIACNASVESQRVEVQLDAPLGDREVYDGVQPEPRPVDRAVETVDVTVVPDGWTAVGMAIAGVEDDTWEQAFGKEGADWYFVVSQQPEADAITPGGHPNAGDGPRHRGPDPASRASALRPPCHCCADLPVGGDARQGRISVDHHLVHDEKERRGVFLHGLDDRDLMTVDPKRPHDPFHPTLLPRRSPGT